MAAFIKLEDSPMFQKQICSLEYTADELKNRCQTLYKGSKKFMTALGEAYNGDNSFADSLEAFGGGQDDPISVSIGGPIMSKFINAFRELASYKELLRSQVEHVLIDRLMHFMTVDLQDAKESRRRFDKAINAYDQDLQNSKSAFERSRFNLVNALMNIEAKKKYEFLESISAIMDGHLRYFKLGYELLSQLEPFIHQVLTYAQQAKELANAEQDRLEKRIQEFRTQAEIDTLRASSNIEPSTSSGSIPVIGMNSDKNIEAIMQSSTKGEVQTIKQGYLLKRSSSLSLRGDWKRRFFVLDSEGTLYYYRNKGTKPMGSHHQYAGSAEHNSGVFARFRARHNRSSSFNEETLGCHTVDLHTSTIKMDAEDTDLRLCFRIISPLKTYTLQAENGADRMDWVNKITAVITSLLNSHILQQHVENNDYARRASSNVRSPNRLGTLEIDGIGNRAEPVSAVLREIPGNDVCAECNAPEPDWASLNLGILLCIECSGVHRNLGVHVSKVRSLTLDVKVWEPSIVELFRTLGNAYCNSVWEGSLPKNERVDESNVISTSITKPCSKDVISHKEKYINAKYVEKLLIIRDEMQPGVLPKSTNIWQAVKTDNLREVYRLLAISDTNIVNTTFDDAFSIEFYHHAVDAQDSSLDSHKEERKQYDPSACQRIKDSHDPRNCLQGCSVLHLACQCGNPVMVELLLQFSADINMRDFHGRTPLHHCISIGNSPLAKHLLRRGARSTIKDGGGLSALERAMEKGAITDEELFILLSES
ncbi:ADP-ribosylation factor GTPase-activating protein AGD4-like isoform X2 [Durio zibethinus]|uniref:ADP-ribosylation factor GTPase-activating protein AGD4-like isoform X2 n=1 Tax=Durio zibethinus TaxID=66656 RepID=A0A6P6BHP1_DURZI|nr:ADP-ribosylation factor GTPase-activating protein AGD4-like isoform X2 [Durio zibethinus]